jgi:HPt (histidine-containing phosphotransfer) domain-containing protein
MSAGVPAVLDADALARLRDLDPMGKTQLVERVLKAFATSSTRLGLQFKEARARDDMAGIRHVAHTLKSSSASIGALALARICAEIETSIRAGIDDGLAAQLDAMDRELVAVLQAVTPMLTPGTPP